MDLFGCEKNFLIKNYPFLKGSTKQNRPRAGGWAVVPHGNEPGEMTRSVTDSRNKY